MQISKKCVICGCDFYPRKDKYWEARCCSLKCRCTLAGREGSKKRKELWDILTDKQKNEKMKVAFFKHVDKTESCWLWRNANKGKGKLHYGSLAFRGKSYLAHRASWKLHNGDIPERMWVLHKCDNPSCVNPDHLFLGTALDNQRDKLEKGRCVVERLTVKKVKEIRNKLEMGVRSDRLAKDYGVSATTIHCIKSRKTWKDIQS